jgi:hypothetical protein
MKGIVYLVVVFLLLLVCGKTAYSVLGWIYNTNIIVPIIICGVLALFSWARTNP